MISVNLETSTETSQESLTPRLLLLRFCLPPSPCLPEPLSRWSPVSPRDLSRSVGVIQLARKAPGGKAPGPDGVPMKVLRIPRVAAEIVDEMNHVLAGNPVPPQWKTLASKKPGSTRKEDHRGISLMSCAIKIFNRLLLHRLLLALDPFLRSELNGFRPHRGTTTQILALRQVPEGSRTHQSS